MTDTAKLGGDEFLEFIVQPERRHDPYPFYDRLRNVAPMFDDSPGLAVVSTYDYVSLVLRDDRFSTDERNSPWNEYDEELRERPFSKLFFDMLLFRDDPDHKRIRDLVQKGFTRRMVENLKGRIGGIVDELVDHMIDEGNVDLIEAFAYPVPVVVICELLGVPIDDRSWFEQWGRDLAQRFEVQPLRTPEQEERGDVAVQGLMDYLDGLIADKRKSPGDDLISSLIAVEDAGDKLTHHELLATCILILFAGHETTANLIGNGTRALLEHRDQWRRLVAAPDMARSAVEELLRFDTPVQVVQRTAMEDVRLDDENTIEKGRMVAPLLGAANRDPRRYNEPDRLDLGRDEAPLVAFGGGIHFCLGAPLARLEAQIAFKTLAQRMPDLDFAGEYTWRPGLVIRGLETLPVSAS